MHGKMKRVVVSMLAVVMVLSQAFAMTVSAAPNESNVKDLILLENVPEAKATIEGNKLRLSAVHIYEDGHFMKTSENLTWESSDNSVATVDQKGEITFSNGSGQALITVSDGTHSDQIQVQASPSPKVIKESGDRYDIIQQAINSMTIEEKVGQMLMPDFRKWEGENVTEMLPEIEEMVKDYHLGGVILFRENVVTTEQTARLVSDYQEASEKYGLLMTIDQEGGIVTRLQSGTDMPGNMALGAARSEKTTQDVGRVIGEELSSLGINMNLAPVLDVNNNPDNPVIGVRSFGGDPELVANQGIAYIKGLQETGIAATAKHFPGHGDTAVDSHLGLPEVPHDKERLKQVELYPFQQAMEAGIDAIMTAHVTFPKIDDTKVISKEDGTEISLPATLSHKVLTGLMREEMGHDGVIITDAMNMGAIVNHFGTVDAAIRTVKAGTDIVLMPVGLPEVADGLLDAVSSGDISIERIEKSVERILTLKIERGILKSENPEDVESKVKKALETVGSDEHKAVEKEAARKSITLLKNDDVLPLEKEDDEDEEEERDDEDEEEDEEEEDDDRIVVVGKSFVNSLGDAVKAHYANTTVIELDSSYELTKEQEKMIRSAESVIVGTYTYSVWTRSSEHPQMKMVNKITNMTDEPVIGVGIRNPYDIMAYPNVDGYLAQYGFRAASFEATAATIFGENDPSGKLPVTIPGENGTLYEFGHGLTY